MSNFSMREFVKRGLLTAVGKQPDYWIIQTATGWCEKSVLELSDLEEIQNALDAKDAESNAVTITNTITVTETDNGETVIDSDVTIVDDGENAVDGGEIVTDDGENAADNGESADGATP